MQFSFRERDSENGVSKHTFENWVNNLGVSEEEAVSMALAHAIFNTPVKNVRGDEMPTYELSDEEFEYARGKAAEELADFKPGDRVSLFISCLSA
jgi:lipoate-protein ligase A